MGYKLAQSPCCNHLLAVVTNVNKGHKPTRPTHSLLDEMLQDFYGRFKSVLVGRTWLILTLTISGPGSRGC